ncbi:hypothetical protein GCM10027321_45680 [Massilia terrae]
MASGPARRAQEIKRWIERRRAGARCGKGIWWGLSGVAIFDWAPSFFVWTWPRTLVLPDATAVTPRLNASTNKRRPGLRRDDGVMMLLHVTQLLRLPSHA